MQLLFYIHLFTTIALTGLVWFVQVVHYPIYHLVDEDSWIPYQATHIKLAKWVTLYPMLIEALSGLGVLFLAYQNNLSSDFIHLIYIDGILALSVWVSTLGIQYPIHMKLCQKRDDLLIKKLISTNWFRVVIWSFRSLIVIYAWSLS